MHRLFKNIKNIKKISKKTGFTLIELLVVISIISFVATFTVIQIQNTRAKARDAIRKDDIKKIDTAIQFYIDERGYAPDLQGTCGDSCTAVDNNNPNWNLFELDLANFINPLPKDPLHGTIDTGTIPWYNYYYQRYSPAYYADKGYGYVSGADEHYVIVAESLETETGCFWINRSLFASLGNMGGCP